MRSRRLLFVALVGLWAVRTNAGLAAAPAILCEDVCSGGNSCNAECWLTQFEFDQAYPPTTCGAQGYNCCGDGMCDSSTDGCNGCTDDCGEVPTCENGCDGNGDCASGEVCNASRQCVPFSGSVSGEHTPTCGGSCTNSSQCCGNDVCHGTGWGGQGYCAIPSTSYCPDAPSCATNNDCTVWANGFATSCTYGVKDVYCDPGIDRCQFNLGTDCPSSGNICKPPPFQ